MAIAGTILIGIAAIGGGRAKEIEIPPLQVFGRIVAGFFGLALIGLSLWVYFNPPSEPKAGETTKFAGASPSTSTVATSPTSTPPTTAGASLTIEKPKNGGTIHVYDDVRIQVTGAEPDRVVWILVKLGGRYYPQGACDNDSEELSVCRHAQFGDPGKNIGDRFDISAVLTNAKGHRAYKGHYTNGFEAADPPVKPLAKSPAVTVHRV
jgi:hypothetical protein